MPCCSGARWAAALVWAAVLVVPSPAQQVRSAASAPFVGFEGGPVEPLLLSPDGDRLYLINGPDHRIEVFATVLETAGGRPPRLSGAVGQGSGLSGPTPGPTGRPSAGPPAELPTLRHLTSIFTGLEPVSMALHPDDPDLMFVSNHVSDTVSVVDLEAGFVVATIDVGDEPQGLVVAGGKLFVACARAPTVPLAPGQTDPGGYTHHVVCVAEASAPYGLLDLVDVGVIKPRDVVAVDDTVYVIPQSSGNTTTLLDETQTKSILGWDQFTTDAFDPVFEINPILQSPELVTPFFTRGWVLPVAGRIVFDFEFPTLVPQLDDHDVLSIDVDTLAVGVQKTTGVGTILLDLEHNPFTGDLWVAATEAANRTRFEPSLKGDAVENRVAVVAPGGPVQQLLELAPPFTTREHAQPAQIAFADGGVGPRAYVASLGTASIAVLDAHTGAVLEEFDSLGSIPGGLAVDDQRGLLYVSTLGDKSVRVFDVAAGHALVGRATVPYDPEPEAVVVGRRHLYDARASTGHGTDNFSCASCHVFGHFDGVAWDLGDPGGSLGYYFGDTLAGVGGFEGELLVSPNTPILSPMKGPMTTQSLRGLMDPDTKDDLPLHWRGDRRTFHMFRGAFQGLLGGSGITRREIQEFAGYLRHLRYAPNPLQPRDRAYVGLAAEGSSTYGMDPNGTPKAYGAPDVFCITCHNGDFTNEVDFTGSRPTASAGSFTQLFNTAQLRFNYEKDFKFLTGFGALHDGAVDGVRGFMDFSVPNGGGPTFANFDTADKDAVAAFVKSWDSGLAPLVGAQFTLDASSSAVAGAWLDLAEAQAKPPIDDLDLIIRGYRELPDGTVLPRGAQFIEGPGGVWGYQFDTGDFAERSTLLAVADLGLLHFTFTAVPFGMGARLGLDRDEDGSYDNLELLAGTDPTDPDSDDDGYLDGDEPALGGDPLSPEGSLGDTTAPVVERAEGVEVFVDVATLHARTDEPTTLLVELGTASGVYDLPSVAGDPRLARVHDVIVEDLPAGVEVFFRVTASDRDGNPGQSEGSFTTLPPFLHVEEISLVSSGTGPYTVTATVGVLDHTGAPVVGCSVHGFWDGDLGGLDWEQDAVTDGAGAATFVLGPFAPAGATTIAFSPAYVGKIWPPADSYFVGLGGEVPKFFYDQPSNKAHFATVELP